MPTIRLSQTPAQPGRARLLPSRIGVVFTALLFAAFTTAANADEPAQSLHERIEAKLSDMECPGALVGVFPDEGSSETYALGVADVESKSPMTLDMHMRVGSVMKPFLATVALQLCDEGKLSLDDKVSKYVEGVPAGDQITLRMLGNNTSGLFNTIENKEFQDAIMKDPALQWTPAEIFKYTWVREPYFKTPGEGWRYSNTNAVLLALCIEKATGSTFAEEIERRICQPLNLQHTGVPQAAELPAPRPSAYRNGYPDKVIGYGDVFYNVTNYSSAWTGAAGNLYSTLEDLGRAVRPVMMGELLSDAGRKEFHAWRDTGRDGLEYGFFVARRDGGIGHTGDVPGFNAFCLYYPEHKAAIVVLTNLSNNKDGTMPAEELAKIVREHWEK